MINCWIAPYSNKELSISFSANDAIQFVERIKRLLDLKSPQSMEVTFKNGVISSSALMLLEFSNDDEVLNIQKGRIKITLTEEAIEYAIFKMEKFVKEGDFSPPEYYGFDTENCKNRVQVYFLKQ